MNAQIVTVNLIPELSAPAVVRVSQYDVGRPLVFRVMDGMSMATLPQYWSAKVEGTKPSGLGFSETCTISGSTVTVSTTEAMTQECGQIMAEISFTHTGVVIGTANFILAVEPSPHPDGTTDGTYETMADLEARVAALESGQSGTGLTQEEKDLILALFAKAAYADDDAALDYDELAALWTIITRSVSYSLTHVTSSNTSASVQSGESYTTTLTADTNYTLNSVTVTMGGVDITSTAYSSGTVSIPSVTGNIVITATAVLAAQSITATYTQSGTVYDTDSLDSLKADLVVTANYAGGTSETVPASDYTLSGTLTEGTSTITVSYAGLTTTFNVIVTHEATYVQTGLIHRWDGIDNTLNGHDGSTTTWYDLVGTDNLLMNGAVTPTWNTDSLSFPGTQGQRLLGSNDAETVGTQTIELCFLPTASQTAGLFIPLGNTTNGKMCIYSDNTFGVNGASGKTYQNPESAITALNHIAVVIENGVITAAYGNATVATLSSKTHSFTGTYSKRVLGQSNERNSSNTYPFNGKVFSARIYNRALSASEITNNYETDVARFGLGE